MPTISWAFNLSVHMGFRQVPLNVDELNCPRFCFVLGGIFVFMNNTLSH